MQVVDQDDRGEFYPRELLGYVRRPFGFGTEELSL
jgi:hypothetical protein